MACRGRSGRRVALATDRDLKSHDNQGAVIPNPDGDDKPVEVDLVKGTARIRRK